MTAWYVFSTLFSNPTDFYLNIRHVRKCDKGEDTGCTVKRYHRAVCDGSMAVSEDHDLSRAAAENLSKLTTLMLRNAYSKGEWEEARVRTIQEKSVFRCMWYVAVPLFSFLNRSCRFE